MPNLAQQVDSTAVNPAAAAVPRFPALLRAWPGWTLPRKVLPRTGLIFVPLAVVASLVFFLLYTTQMSATQRVIAAGQDQLVQVGYTTFSSTLSTLANDVQFVADEPLLTRWLATGDAGDREIVEAQFYSFIAHRGIYDKVRFIDLDAHEQLRVNWNDGKPFVVRKDRLQDNAILPVVKETLKLKTGQVFFSRFDFNVENGRIEEPIKPTLRVSTPIFDNSGRERGVIVLNFLGQRVLDRVARLSTERLGEAWLIDASGFWLLGPSAADEWGFMYPDRQDRSFAHDFPAAWQKMAEAPSRGQFTVDGDLFTYAAVSQPAGELGQDLTPASAVPDWYIVTRTNADAYSHPSPSIVRDYSLALGAVLLLLAGIAWTIAYHSVRRRQAEYQVLGLNEKLARDNTALESANRELESFSYSVSHDLRAPLRSIDGFSQALLEDYAHALDAGGQDYLMRVRNAAQRMGNLIDDLIRLSRVTRSDLTDEAVDLSLLARRTLAELQRRDPDRVIEIAVAPDVHVRGDSHLLQIALENLLDNAWKFTAKRTAAVIEFGEARQEGKPVYFVRDNGAGFDMAHAGKLFGVFQRLHAVSDFEGTGIGLATVQRIVYKHGGKVWVEAEKDRGATFFFTLRAGAKQHETNTPG